MVVEDGFLVRPWTEADLEGVFRLVDRENWGWELAEIRRIHRLDPVSSVVAEEDGELAGLVTVIRYGMMAFMVHVIVREDRRRSGLGKAMVRAALDRLEEHGVSRSELHANPDVLEFYRQLGFTGADEIAFYSRDPADVKPGLDSRRTGGRIVKLLGADEYGTVARLISESMNVDADEVARAMRADPPDVVVGAVECGCIKGALVGKVGVLLNGIGPWVMEELDEPCAREMLRTAVARLPARRIDVCIASKNDMSRDVAESEGFRLVKGGMVRAVRSAALVPLYPPSLLAVGHFGVV